MQSRSIITAIALAAAVCPLAAQTLAVADNTPRARIIATYAFRNGPKDSAFPQQVVITDSAGTLQANLVLANGRGSLPMTVSVVSSDLVLEAETQKGLLTLVLNRQNDVSPAKFEGGRWALGGNYGQLLSRGQP
jgi:hypothetical protein